MNSPEVNILKLKKQKIMN